MAGIRRDRTQGHRGRQAGGWLSGALGALLAMAGGTSTAQALEFDELSDDAKADVLELREMTESRGIGADKFQFHFRPIEFDRVVLRAPSGTETVYHYLTFHLRNQTANEAGFVFEHAVRYDEVRQAILDQFNSGDGPGVSTDDTGALVVNTEAIPDEDVARVLQRDQFQPETRVARLTSWIEDENGSRFRAWNPFPDADIDALYNFEDRGQERQSAYYQDVREAVEERVGRRLFTVHELRNLALPPYDANQPGVEDGLYKAGEVYGVILFDRLPRTGDRFVLHINGLSNHTRRVERQEFDRDELVDYYGTRILRRGYRIELERPGDEFHMSLRRFTMGYHGWVWNNGFMRLRLRRDIAYATYLLDNIRLERERRGAGGRPEIYNREIADTATQFVRDAIDQEWPELLRLKSEYLANSAEEVRAAYQVELDERQAEADRVDVRERLSRRDEDVQRREASIAAIADMIADSLEYIEDAVATNTADGE